MGVFLRWDQMHTEQGRAFPWLNFQMVSGRIVRPLLSLYA